MELKNIEQKANHYYSTLARPLADEKGLVETAFVIGYAEAILDNKRKVKSDSMTSLLEDFCHWINNNWYEPMGEDGMWRKNENAEIIPKVNLFTCEELATEYLNDVTK